MALARRTGGGEREGRVARLPIDRAFLIAGFGPVVTGSLVSGTISKDQKLELLPERRPVRVRRIEVHGREEPVARAGERVSANLAGVELQDLRRGLVLATPGALPVTQRLHARLELLPDAPRVKSGDRVSRSTTSPPRRARRCAFSTAPRSLRALPPASSFASPTPIAAIPGDRFVVRRLSPVQTIGGGIVLDPLPAAMRGRLDAARREALDRVEKGPLAERLLVWVEEGRDRGAGEEALAQRAGVSTEAVRAALARAAAERPAPRPAALAGALPRRARARAPCRPGRARSSRLSSRSRKRRRRRVSQHASRSDCFPAPTRAGRRRSRRRSWREAPLVVAGDEARAPGREDLAAPERDLAERIAAVFAERGLNPPSPGEAAELVRHRPKVVEGLIGYLAKKGTLVRLPGGWIIARSAVDDVVARLRASGKPSLDVGEFKEMFGLTRRLAIPLLEHLDATKVTRRVGDRREVVIARG